VIFNIAGITIGTSMKARKPKYGTISAITMAKNRTIILHNLFVRIFSKYLLKTIDTVVSLAHTNPI